MKISIHRALAEVKLIDKKLSQDRVYITSCKKSQQVIQGKTRKEFEAELFGNVDSVLKLLENRKKLKSAISQSNAITKVVVGNKEYTVAEAIERKKSVDKDVEVLNTMTKQYNMMNATADKNNADIPSKLESYLTSVLGEKGSRNPADIELHTRAFNDANVWSTVDPHGLSEVIKTLRENVDTFLTEVDFVLSESNASTFIEVEL